MFGEMRSITLYIVLLLFLQSCNSHKKDLSRITFTEKYDTFFGDIPNDYKENHSMIDYNLYDVYDTESEKALYFNQVDLSGYRDKKGEFGTNHVSFEFSKKNKILQYYSMQLFTNKKTSKLINVLNNKIGKPSYISMLDSNDTLPDAILWEDKTSFYLITGATQNQIDFIVFNKQNKAIREKLMSGSFQYYGDYLDYLEKNNLKIHVFSYKNFVDYKTKEGNNYYIEDYKKP